MPVKEYNGQRVVTFKEIDTVHERPEGTAGRNFNTNKRHFIEGVDYFHLSYEETRSTKFVERPNSQGVTILTESGYLMLVKSFTDDLAWTVQRQLINVYFCTTPEQRREAAKQTLLEIPKDYPSALRKLADTFEEKQALEAKIEEDAPKVDFANDAAFSKDAITVERYAKAIYTVDGINLGRNKLFRWLRDKGYLRQNNLPYQKWMDAGYFETSEKICNGRFITLTLITGKGQLKLHQKIKAAFVA